LLLPVQKRAVVLVQLVVEQSAVEQSAVEQAVPQPTGLNCVNWMPLS